MYVKWSDDCAMVQDHQLLQERRGHGLRDARCSGPHIGPHTCWPQGTGKTYQTQEYPNGDRPQRRIVIEMFS